MSDERTRLAPVNAARAKGEKEEGKEEGKEDEEEEIGKKNVTFQLFFNDRADTRTTRWRHRTHSLRPPNQKKGEKI